MIAILSLLIIILLSIAVVRIGSIALELTGLSPEIASFQAQSAFSGVGFTTVESEAIVTHPVRRRIIRVLILLGGAGVTTSIATLVLAFVGQTGEGALVRGQMLIFGLLFIFFFARSRHINSIMRTIITKALQKWTSLRIYDYEEMFGVGEGYVISKILVKEGSWFRDKLIKDLTLELSDILILAISRKSGDKRKIIGAPHGDAEILAGEELICYGTEEAISKIFSSRN